MSSCFLESRYVLGLFKINFTTSLRSCKSCQKSQFILGSFFFPFCIWLFTTTEFTILCIFFGDDRAWVIQLSSSKIIHTFKSFKSYFKITFFKMFLTGNHIPLDSRQSHFPVQFFFNTLAISASVGFGWWTAKYSNKALGVLSPCCVKCAAISYLSTP